MLDIRELERKEFLRQDQTLNFIASENYPSEDIIEANGSIFMNKYAEGFANARYYQGVSVVDELETECMTECLKAFKAEDEYLCNVQMSSGCQANITVYHALLKKGDKVLGPDTASLGHISHGIKGSFLDTYFEVHRYGLNDKEVLDYDEIERIAIECQPKLIICGASNYSRVIDFKRFKEIADKVGAYLMADISHIAGLVVAGKHQSPVGYADIITSTLHKTMKGVRGAIIVYKKDLDKKIKYATIPGLWGGSHINNTLAKLVTFREAQTVNFDIYINQLMKNTFAMTTVFNNYDIPIVSDYTENHVFCLKLTDFPVNGKELAVALESIGIVSNANAIPNDTSFIKPHGLRLGCAPVTARGVDENECAAIAQGIAVYLNFLKDGESRKADEMLEVMGNFVKVVTSAHPLKHIYPKRYELLFGTEV